ncbi:Coiled-coil domain-containing protein 172 [Sciurus carolinensis]|uniref:Coiled-coil domain-containing protein 172 n=1 Tax=Sciurus carolinensis TaxID=30640 RepID=A0AA41MR95_SCICA|nr:Coiled-coil domain-containing protein 172 [Sciurus carolinensis]
MSLESLFQHIIFSEHQAEESRRVMREGRVFLPFAWDPLSSPAGSLGKVKNPRQWSGPLREFALRMKGKRAEKWPTKCHWNVDLRKIGVSKDLICITVRSEITRCREKIKKATEELNEEKIKLESKESTKKRVTEEEEKFIKEITDFNNEYEITKKRELLMKENVKIEISDLENQANILKWGMSA